jgi:hypothetical protein
MYKTLTFDKGTYIEAQITTKWVITFYIFVPPHFRIVRNVVLSTSGKMQD